MGLDVIDRSLLGADASRYDLIRAAPSQEELGVMWIVWSLVAGISAVFCIVVLCAVLYSYAKGSREGTSPFNLYLAALMLPDIFFSANCAVTCALNFSHHGYFSTAVISLFQVQHLSEHRACGH